MRRIVVAVACLAVVGMLSAAPGADAASRPRGMAARRGVESGRTASPARVQANAAGVTNHLSSYSSRQLKLWALQNRANVNGGGGPNYELECTKSRGGKNTNLTCDHAFLPANEPDIEVDPEDPDHMIASWNDYESCCDGFGTTFDGGETWFVGDMSTEDTNRIGSDPVTVFDPVTDTAIHSSLNFIINDAGEACDGDLVVSLSHDGGITWEEAIVVNGGRGCDSDPVQIFNDKEWIVTDTNPTSPFYGRTYITWSRFVADDGAYVESAIWESHSDDGGQTWSRGQEISGSNPTRCTFQEAGAANQCDENQFSVPTVAPDGTVYVAFENEQNEALWEPGELFDNQYLVVKSTNGGASWTSPRFVVGLEDGSNDYPINVDGRQTLTNYQIRVNSAGNIVAGPAGELYLVFADNRAGVRDTARPRTNTNVYMMYSANGTTWSGPHPVDTSAKDQWFPWVDVSDTGEVKVLYHSRRPTDPDLYDTRVATGHPLTGFSRLRVNTAPSNPVFSLFFRAQAPGCRRCATFHGDYNRIAFGSDGVAHMGWTDMRKFVSFGGASDSGHTEEIFWARDDQL